VRVLFVCSGNKAGNPKEVVRNQGKALMKQGIDLDFFCTRGNGISAYLKAISGSAQKVKRKSA